MKIFLYAKNIKKITFVFFKICSLAKLRSGMSHQLMEHNNCGRKPISKTN